MSAKNVKQKFVAHVRFEVELRANSWDAAVAEAEALKNYEVYYGGECDVSWVDDIHVEVLME